MTLRPAVFISAVSKELRATRDLVAKVLSEIGYEPVWQDIFGTEQGSLCKVLREKINDCQGVIQLVGFCYGVAPPLADPEFGRVSYTQYEAYYAKQQGKKVWYFIDTSGSTQTNAHGEPEELRVLQSAYRKRLLSGTDVYYEFDLKNDIEVENRIHKIRDDLSRMRRLFRLWMAAVTLLLLVILMITSYELRTHPSRTISESIVAVDARTAFLRKDYATAFHMYERLSDSDPRNLALHRQIEECSRRGGLEAALLNRYMTLSKEEPSNAIFHNYLGNAWLMLDPSDADGKAKEQYEIARRLSPSSTLPFANLGILAYRSGKTNEAESLFQQYLADFPDDAQGWVNLGLLYVNRVETNANDNVAVAEADKALRKAVDIDPSSARAYKTLGRLWVAMGRKKEALNLFQRSLALDYDQPDVRQNVEMLAWESGGARFPGIADDFQTRGQREDASIRPAAIVAMQWLDQRQFPQAKAICLEWIKVEPENPLAWRLLGRAEENLGHAAEAQASIEKAERLASGALKDATK